MILGPNGKPVSSRSFRPAASEHAFEAAKRTGYRGWFYFPTLEPSAQMPRETRERTAEKINWLYNNVGAVQTVIDGLTLDEVDTGLWPKSTSSSDAFNAAVTDAFDNEGKDARVFHAAARENVYSAQWLIRRSIKLHGELFGQMLRPETPGGSPSMHFVNAWQCRNASTSQDQSLWTEGQMLNRLARVIQYRFVTNRDGTEWVDQSADDVLHFHDKFWNGQTRGMSGLAPVARKLFSIDDIERAETSGTLLRTRLAYAITKKDDDGAGPSLLPGASETEEVENSKGEKFQIQKVISRDGSEVDVADLPAGFDIKVVESARGPMTAEFIKFLLTDVAYSTLYPPEYVFQLAGITNGTLVRLVQKRVQRIKNTVRQFQIAPQFLSRWYVFWLWQRIKAGRFANVPGGIPADWWKHKVNYPADDTVDVGREGRLYDDRVATGKMSDEDYHALNGRDADDVETEIIAARVRRLRKIKAAQAANPDVAEELSYETIFRAPAGSAAAAPNGANEPDEPSGKQGDKSQQEEE